MHTRILGSVGIPLAVLLTGLAACSAEGEPAKRAAAPESATGSQSPTDAESSEPEPAPLETATPETESEPESQPEARAEPAEPEAVAPESQPDTGQPEQNQAAPAESAPPLQSFTGLSGRDGVFAMHVNEAYVDDDGVVTDGMGTTERAADGSEFVIFNVQITNESSAPAYFDWGGSYAYDTAGNQYIDDYEAAFAACDTYCNEDLNPGATAETDVIFEMPEGTDIVSLEIMSDPYAMGGSPAVIEP